MGKTKARVNNFPLYRGASISHSAAMRENSEVIPLPAMRRLWRVKFADSIMVPKLATTVMLRGAETVMDAATKAKKTEGWKAFSGMHKDAEVVAVEFIGDLEY